MDSAMFGLTTVQTARLLLRRVEEQDQPFIRQLDANVDVMRAGHVRSSEESDARTSMHVQHWNQHGFGVWTALDRVTLAYVGTGGLRHIELEQQEVVQVGYRFLPSVWGQGLATELATAAVHAAFNALGLLRLVAVARPTNTASRRVLEKVGFVYARDVLYEQLPHVLYEQHDPRKTPHV